jgi:DNA-binding response OmpR family regulator
MRSLAKHPRFSEGPKLVGHRVQYSDERHLLIIDGRVVTRSRTQYILLMALLQRSHDGLSCTQLLEMTGHFTLTPRSRRNLACVMSRLRHQLRRFQLDIRCLTGYGYTLISTEGEHDAAGSGERLHS